MFPYRITTPNMQSVSCAVVPISLHDESSVLGVGTAFFDNYNGKTYLVTNWHCVTGRQPHSGKPRSRDGRTPLGLEVLYPRQAGEPGRIEYVRRQLPIDFGPSSLWRMHPTGQDVDVVIFEVVEDFPIYGQMSKLVPPDCEAILQAGSDVFILGYPRGLMPTGFYPIWKGGSIATEPVLMAGGEPCFWVDSATREGMSGSPVFVRRPRSHMSNFDFPVLHKEPKVVASQHLAFCGVYSGRMGAADLLEAQLGKVWRPECIEIILSDGIPLNYFER